MTDPSGATSLTFHAMIDTEWYLENWMEYEILLTNLAPFEDYVPNYILY